jgi:hypothetical protein
MNHPFVANLLRRTGGSMPNKMPESGSGLAKALTALAFGTGAVALAYNSAYSGARRDFSGRLCRLLMLYRE